MPYIQESDRAVIGPPDMGGIDSPGSLNFTITKLVHEYICDKGLNYRTINEAIGILECAKLELYRMVAAKYEDKKRIENGPVSDLDAIQLNEVR